MRTFGRVALWPILPWLVLLCTATNVLAHSDESTPVAQSNIVKPTGHTEAHLEGPWRFQAGDDSQWADPAFDDSGWPMITLDKPLTEFGVEPYSGYGWYRIRINVKQLQPASEPLDLLLSTHTVGQLSVFANGTEVDHTRGMDSAPQMYMSLPLRVSLPPAAPDGTILIAVRSWAAPGVKISNGQLERVEVGAHHDIVDRLAMAVSRRWDQQVIARLVLSFLFLCVAALGAILFLAQRHHAEYLWLALLCASVSLSGITGVLWNLALIPFSVYLPLDLWLARFFMVVTLEFIVRFTSEPRRRSVRVIQAILLLLPVVFLLGMEQLYQALSVAAEIVFCGLVIWMLFRGWRRGQREAGVMLLPFFLAATAGSIDTALGYFAEKHWLPEKMGYPTFHVGPIEFDTSIVGFAIFLASLIAVILYRFVRVSQDEQRSNAEIAAARSVQSMLIPTELPKSRNFMLESAYLPVNGVGGDFFQVLPLKDDSLLIVVGDVSGKGLEAAMNSSTLVGALRNELSYEPATVLEHLNRVLLGAGYGEMRRGSSDAGPSFATCLCARAHPDGRFVIANAGHLGPYHDGRELEIPPGLPLGVIPNVEYEQVTYRFNQGDRLVFLSDGVVEATNGEGELFGFERTQQVSNEPARYIAQTAKHFGQTDDITVVSLYIASCEVREPEAVLDPA